MIEQMKVIFGRLAAEVRKRGEEHSAAVPLGERRFIKGSREEEAALQHAEILNIERIPSLGPIALIRWRSQYFFSLPSAISVDLARDEDVIDVVSNAGLSSLLFAHDETKVIAPDVFQLIDAIFGDKGEYPIEVVQPFFTDYVHYQTRQSLDSSAQSELWSRCQALCARTIVRNATTPPWSADCQAAFERASSGTASRVAGTSLLAAAIAGTWSHTFLEVYRAVEALFAVVCVEDLIARLPPAAGSAPRVALVDSLEETLHWRLRQDATIGRLVKRVSKTDASAISTKLGVSTDEIATTLYKTRNRIAHGALRQSPISSQQALLSGCLLLVAAAYDVVSIDDLWLTTP